VAGGLELFKGVDGKSKKKLKKDGGRIREKMRRRRR
jgi:hypothetical protein